MKYLKKHKAMVETALAAYQENKLDSTAGYNIMRYAKNNWLVAVEGCAQDYLDAYPLNMSYIILRQAAAGKLIAKEQTDEV